ncbi:magnesium/cobalt transporter CorA [Subsaxibacter sp. CAU 1640]|uniref:magnesium/cobalt transporter CorA n=1 Tax=Subsaxibacter sp. CAU 1640 TaxID=2933271 RepID=UPI002004738D|nr:magnesium/cobalt transporter CorA [Subsaxibacter sp. CAU 1640]MCK7590997.1 magnesium/cobalt transporter CorA [Subsaxibacter sp. CAU 1640]
MKQKKKNKSYKVRNLSPGTMSYRGEKSSSITDVDIINYSPTLYKVINSKSVEDAFNFKQKDTVTWININGLNNLSEIEKLGNHYGLHPLTLEDIVNTQHRPKMDEFENYLFIVFKMLYHKSDDTLYFEHISMVVGDGYVLTFQEADGDVFDDLRVRISNEKGRIRNSGSDYLMYAILDAVVDHYITVLDIFGDKVEDLEDAVFNSEPNNDMSNNIQVHKREILKIRRSVVPLREVINRLEKTDCMFIEQKTHSFLRDLYDHIVQVNESIDLYREMVWGLMDMYMSVISNKMNEVMKVLTIIATIFIPLTFIAGIYGMNFDNIPELHYRYSYYILWGVMIVIFLLMLLYFRRKKWL